MPVLEVNESTVEPRARSARSARSILLPGEVRRLILIVIFLFLGSMRSVVIPTIALLAGGNDFSEGSWRPGLDVTAFQSAPFATRFHAISILTLLVTGWGMIALPKGDKRHKTLGWVWVCAMSVMGISSLFVPHSDSWVAGYIGGGSALALMAYGVFAAKRRKLAIHGRMMSILMIALVLMSFLALFPGRLLHGVVFGG